MLIPALLVTQTLFLTKRQQMLGQVSSIKYSLGVNYNQVLKAALKCLATLIIMITYRWSDNSWFKSIVCQF